MFSNTRLTYFPELSEYDYEEVDASWNSIRVLWNEDLPRRIRVLNLKGNKIGSDGLLSWWPNSLTVLNLSKNSITSLSEVTQWPTSLRVLNISYNNIEGILNCQQLPQTMEDLNISYTNIQSIVAFPPNLKKFVADATELRYIPPICPDTLQTCIVSNTRHFYRRGLPRTWGTSLEFLELSNLRLREFPQNLPGTLQYLNLSHNSLREFCSLENFPRNLKSLHLGKNRIFKIPHWVSNFPQLRYTIHNNLLVKVPNDPKCISVAPQIIGRKYHNAALCIQKNWRAYKMLPPIRTWYKLSRIKEELLALAMCPARAGRFENVSLEWNVVYHTHPLHEPHPLNS